MSGGFSNPWHWCVHGLGIGQEPIGFEPDKSDRLLEISLALFQQTNIGYYVFINHLLHGIVETCAALSLNNKLAQQRAYDQFTSAIEHLPSESWQYVRACALLTESLVKLGQLETHRYNVHRRMGIAFKQVVKLDADNDKISYEKLQLLPISCWQQDRQDLQICSLCASKTAILMLIQLCN